MEEWNVIVSNTTQCLFYKFNTSGHTSNKWLILVTFFTLKSDESIHAECKLIALAGAKERPVAMVIPDFRPHKKVR